MTGRDRKNQIYDFCYDLGLIWGESPDIRFGQIIKAIAEWHDGIEYISDPECMDILREYFKGE